MDYDALLSEIRRRGEFTDRAHARDAAEAVLSVLGEHLVGGSPAHLADQLPPELAEALPVQGGAEPFDSEAFDLRVAEREGHRCTPADAHRHGVAVVTAVLDSVAKGEAEKIAAQLPADFTDFIPAWLAERRR